MNSSYLQKPQDVERKWYVVDAADKPLGRVAATVASILRGKHLPTFTPSLSMLIRLSLQVISLTKRFVTTTQAG